VYVDGILYVTHLAPPRREAESMPKVKFQAGSRGYRRTRIGSPTTPIDSRGCAHVPGSNRPTISTASLSHRSHRPAPCDDPLFFMKFRGPKAHSNRPHKSMACPK
jgi:hypothetical protein